MNIILHKMENGDNAITQVMPGYNVEKIKKELNGVLISDGDIDFDFINAYDINDNTVNLNLEKAREIKVEEIRKQRDDAFVDFDKRFDIAFKDEIDLTELRVERQKLKDAPELALNKLSSKKTLKDIKMLNLSDLI